MHVNAIRPFYMNVNHKHDPEFSDDEWFQSQPATKTVAQPNSIFIFHARICPHFFLLLLRLQWIYFYVAYLNNENGSHIWDHNDESDGILIHEPECFHFHFHPIKFMYAKGHFAIFCWLPPSIYVLAFNLMN